MYEEFSETTVVTATQTNIRLLFGSKSEQTRFSEPVDFIVDGEMEVHIQKPFLTTQASLALDKGPSVGEIYMLPWWIGQMQGSVTETELGKITVRGNPGLISTGVIRQDVPSLKFPATLEAAVFQVFEVPGFGRLHNKMPVIVDAQVDNLPPIHALGRCRCAILFDDDNNPRGIAGGRSLTFMGVKSVRQGA